MNTFRGYLILSTLLGTIYCVQAEDIAKTAVSAGIHAGFSSAERQIIEKYFGGVVITAKPGETATVEQPKSKKGGKGLPPGLAKRDKLPPGLEKQLQKNGTLPPGLAKRNLPSDLERKLPPVPKGYERRIIENSAIVLVEVATGLIADVITDIVIGD